MITLEYARQFIEKFPEHDAFVEVKNKESIQNGGGDNSVQSSMIWAACKDKIWQTDSYAPIGCDHKKANGWTAWELYSESECTGAAYSAQYLMVCAKCGDIKLSGHEEGKRYEYIFNIHWPEALRAIIKQANFICEEEVFIEKPEQSFSREEVVELLAEYPDYGCLGVTDEGRREAREFLDSKFKHTKL